MGMRKPTIWDLDEVKRKAVDDVILEGSRKSGGMVPTVPQQRVSGVGNIIANDSSASFVDDGGDDGASTETMPSLSRPKPNWKQIAFGVGLPSLFGGLSGAGAITTGAEAAGAISDDMEDMYKTDVNAELSRQKEISNRISDKQQNELLYGKEVNRQLEANERRNIDKQKLAAEKQAKTITAQQKFDDSEEGLILSELEEKELSDDLDPAEIAQLQRLRAKRASKVVK